MSGQCKCLLRLFAVGTARQAEKKPWQIFPNCFCAWGRRLHVQFFQCSDHDGSEADLDVFVNKFGHYVASSRFMPPRQVGKTFYEEKKFFSCNTPMILYKLTSIGSPLQPVYQGFHKVLDKSRSIFYSTCDME